VNLRGKGKQQCGRPKSSLRNLGPRKLNEYIKTNKSRNTSGAEAGGGGQSKKKIAKKGMIKGTRARDFEISQLEPKGRIDKQCIRLCLDPGKLEGKQ